MIESKIDLGRIGTQNVGTDKILLRISLDVLAFLPSRSLIVRRIYIAIKMALFTAMAF